MLKTNYSDIRGNLKDYCDKSLRFTRNSINYKK